VNESEEQSRWWCVCIDGSGRPLWLAATLPSSLLSTCIVEFESDMAVAVPLAACDGVRANGVSDMLVLISSPLSAMQMPLISRTYNRSFFGYDLTTRATRLARTKRTSRRECQKRQPETTIASLSSLWSLRNLSWLRYSHSPAGKPSVPATFDPFRASPRATTLPRSVNVLAQSLHLKVRPLKNPGLPLFLSSLNIVLPTHRRQQPPYLGDV
jgi:hypothetical protein